MTHEIRTMFPDATADDLAELQVRLQHTQRLLAEQSAGTSLSDTELRGLYEEDKIFSMGVDLILWEARRTGAALPQLLLNVVYFVVISLRSERARAMLRSALEEVDGA